MGLDLSGIGGILKVLDLPGTLVSEGCQLLGLPPALGNALKIGLGAATGDFMMVADGAVNLGSNLQASAMAATAYCPPLYPGSLGVGYCPPAPWGGMGSPGFREQELSALTTLADNFPTADAAGSIFQVHDGKVQMNDLLALANGPCTPLDLKRAARFFVDNPGEWMRVARSRTDPFSPPFASLGDMQLAIESLSAGLQQGGCCPPGLPMFPCPTTPGVLPYPPPPAGGAGVPCYGPFPPGGLLGTGYGAPFPLNPLGTSPFGLGCGPLSTILNNPTMSSEDKMEAVLLQLQNQTDNDMLSTTTALNSDNSRLAQIPINSTEQSAMQQRAQIQNDQQMLQLNLQKLMDRRKNLFDLMTNIQQKFNDMSMLAIQNLGR